MQKIVLALVGAAAVLSTPALSADLQMATKAPAPAAYVSPWDVAFGGSLASDYNFRGISQSRRNPSVAAYFEPRFNLTPNLQLYAGIAGASISFPGAVGGSDPAAEVDFYAGIRPTFGPVSLDFGYLYYYYPGEIAFQTDFWEVYGKASWAINDVIAIGANVFYSPSWLNTGAPGTYASGTLKLTAPGSLIPEVGAYASGELGRYWLGTTTALADLPDYTYWNVGFGFTYKMFTLDFRYHDTDTNYTTCSGITGISTNGPGQTNICAEAFIAKLSFDATIGAFK